MKGDQWQGRPGELRLLVADAHSLTVRRPLAKQVSRHDPNREREALRWIEIVAVFDPDK